MNKKSDIFAPSGPPKFSIVVEEDLLKKPESLWLCETKDIKIYKEIAIKKKLKKLSKVFSIYLEALYKVILYY